MSEAGWAMALSLEGNPGGYVLGAEIGALFERMKHEPDAFDQIIHLENAEMAIRCCEATDRQFSAEELDENWTMLHVEAAGLPTEGAE